MVLLDTDLMIDVIRGYPPAVAWLDSLAEKNERVMLPGFVVMELIQGCANNDEIANVQKEVEAFIVRWPSELSCEKALAKYTSFHLSQGLSIIDSLIGQMAEDLGTPLHTFNKRHFENAFALETVQPYQRE